MVVCCGIVFVEWMWFVIVYIDGDGDVGWEVDELGVFGFVGGVGFVGYGFVDVFDYGCCVGLDYVFY